MRFFVCATAQLSLDVICGVLAQSRQLVSFPVSKVRRNSRPPRPVLFMDHQLRGWLTPCLPFYFGWADRTLSELQILSPLFELCLRPV